MNMRNHARLAGLCATAILCGALAGCGDQPTLFANPDPELQHTNKEWQGEAQAHFPYKSDAPHEKEAKVRAQVGYDLNRLEVVNFTGKDWDDVEVWVNRRYVCHLPKLQDRQLKEVHFSMLYDAVGNTFPWDNSKVRVEKVELYHDGTMYDIVCHNADW
jgi:hypothetical protein